MTIIIGVRTSQGSQGRRETPARINGSHRERTIEREFNRGSAYLDFLPKRHSLIISIPMTKSSFLSNPMKCRYHTDPH